MDKKILEYIRKSKPNKTLKEALNELPEEISKYFSEGDRKRKEDEFAELWLRTEVLQEKRYRITIKGVGSVLKKKDDFEAKLFSYLINWYSITEAPDVKQWIFENNDSLQILINMHQFGYEIEKRQLYTVRIIKTEQYLYGMGDRLSFVNIIHAELENNPMIAFSRRQLEAKGFGWVFDCEGVEVKEVKNE